MKFLLVFLCAFFSLAVVGQVVPIRGDTVRVYKQGGNATIRIENATRAILGGVATNIDGKGTLGFVATHFNGDTIFIGGDTVINENPGSGGGGGGGDSALNLYVENGIYAFNDSTARLGHNPLLENTTINGENGFDFIFDSTRLLMAHTRFEETKGASVAAANNLTLGSDGNLFTITGHTQITAITTANWQAGSTIGFVFADTPILKHNTAGGGGTAVMLLAGNTDYQAAVGDYIAFRYDGTSWHETSRRLTSGAGVYGIDAVLAVGQALTANRSIQNGAFSLSIQGSSSVLGLVSTGGNALVVTGSANSAAAASIAASGSGNIGAVISSTGNWAVQLSTDRASTNSIVTLMNILRTTSNTAGSGIGAAVEFAIESAGGTSSTSHLLESYLTVVTAGSETSEWKLIGKLSGASQDVQVIRGNGVWNAPGVANWGNFANNAAALGGGLVTGDLYRNGDVVQIVH